MPLLPKKRISNKSRPKKRNAKSRAQKKRWETVKEQMKIAAEESGRLPHLTGVKVKEEITEEWEESILPTLNSNEEINLTEGKSLSNDVENSSPLHIRLDIKIEEEKCEEWEESNIGNKPEQLQQALETKRDDKEVKQNSGEVNELERLNSASVQDDDVNEQNMEGNIPSTAEALSSLKTLKQFLSFHKKQELNLQKFAYIENCVKEIVYKTKKANENEGLINI